VCCTHEYTLSNLKFAQAIEPDNGDLAAYTRHCQQQRALNFPTLPSSIGLEKRINPFLRTAQAAVVRSARAHEPATTADPVSVFATLRTWKNNFK
jgi:hydroxyacylglutathione hydrolase